ncbi:MAG: tyrosine-type recombinase/integrase [Arachidicoccus sp.]|nr:tyrosine-type recombinase/integrase [Arachidicoccus sp.]
MTKRISEPIYVVLKEQAKNVIHKWGIPSDNKDDYVFPFLKDIESKSEIERKQIKQVTKIINKYLNIIGMELELPFKLTTYVGQHTFAAIIVRNGADLPMLKSLLGHSSIVTSEKYVSTLPLNDLEKLTDKLVEF